MLTELKQKISEPLAKSTKKTQSQIFSLLEIPKNLDHGEISLPVFAMAKELKKAPPLIAKELADDLNKINIEGVEKVDAISGFVNFHFKTDFLQDVLMKAVSNQGQELGFSKVGSGKKVVVDYSSPNVAKKMTIGHLRATVIGQAICNLAKSQSYEVIGLNHIGDWGSQFGKLAYAIEKWGDEYKFSEKPMDELTKIYVRFHDEAEKNPDLNLKGAEYFKKLEEGEANITKIWQKIINWSLEDYNRLYEKLGVKHDLVRGESYYNNRLQDVIDRLNEQSLLVESQGAMVVEMDGDNPPCLIQKADGASLYATRDLASAIHRKEDLGADLNLYVTGAEQSLHFKQVFSVLEKLGYAWAKDCHHISFGLYRFKDIGKMSTRKGNVIYFEDVLDKSIAMVREVIESKNPDLENKELVAEQVGIGAVIFNDLVNDRVKNVEFDWQKATSFDGDSGPYVQYCLVRCNSLIKKYARDVPNEFAITLSSDEERALLKQLLFFDQILSNSFKYFKPHFLAGYLLDVCKAFNHFYHQYRILGEADEVESSRICLVHITQQVLAQGLAVLGMSTPEAM